MEKKDYIVAIDLGTNTVVAMVGTKSDNNRIKVIDCEMLPVQGMVRGEIKNIEQVAAAIKQAVEAIEGRLGIKIVEAYTGISGQHIKCVRQPYHVFVGRDGEIREEDVRKLHESMRNVQAPDGEKIIQIIPQNYIVDDEEETDNPVGTFGKKLEATFNFVIGDANAVNRLERALSRLEIKSLGLFLNSVAAAEATATADEKEEGVAVIDIGGGTTDVTIYYKNIIRHVGIIPMGGNAINKDIRSYGILEKHVESLKVKYGSAMRDLVQADKYITTPGLNARAPKEISFKNLAAIIEARMLDIIDLVMEEIKQSGYKDKLGAGVILTGGTAQLKDLAELFKSYTGLDVRVAVPDVDIEEGLQAELCCAMATAAGIVIKGLENGKATKVEKRPAETEAQNYNHIGKARTPLSQRSVNDLYDNRTVRSKYEDETGSANGYEDSDNGYEDEGRKKGGFFGKLKEKINNMFDVIDDNEI